jgi:hypothetical protein
MIPSALAIVWGLAVPLADNGKIAPVVSEMRVRMLFLKPGMTPEQARKLLQIDPKMHDPFNVDPDCQKYLLTPDCVLTLFFWENRHSIKPLSLQGAELSRRGKIVAAVKFPDPPLPPNAIKIDPALIRKAIEAVQKQSSQTRGTDK